MFVFSRKFLYLCWYVIFMFKTLLRLSGAWKIQRKQNSALSDSSTAYLGVKINNTWLYDNLYSFSYSVKVSALRECAQRKTGFKIHNVFYRVKITCNNRLSACWVYFTKLQQVKSSGVWEQNYVNLLKVLRCSYWCTRKDIWLFISSS